MNINSLRPPLSKRVQFRLSESFRVPQSPGCYALASIDDDVIYIGRSVNLYNRMQQHLDNPRMNQRTLLGVANWFYYEQWTENSIANIEELLLFNYKAIEGRLPPLNRVGP